MPTTGKEAAASGVGPLTPETSSATEVERLGSGDGLLFRFSARSGVCALAGLGVVDFLAITLPLRVSLILAPILQPW
jgi:hypothetical protein